MVLFQLGAWCLMTHDLSKDVSIAEAILIVSDGGGIV